MNNNNNSEQESSDEDVSSDEEKCPICLDIQTCDSIIMECCNKLIHSDCLIRWLQYKNNCPLCRTHQSLYYNTPTNNFTTNNSTSLGTLNIRYFQNTLDSINNLLESNNIDIGISHESSSSEDSYFSSIIQPRNFGRSYENDSGISFNNNLINDLDEMFNNDMFNDDMFNDLLNEIETGITIYQNNEDIIGVSFINTNENLGISSMNIENNNFNNSLNIHINGDVFLNINNDSIPMYVRLMRNFIEEFTNLDNEYLDVD